MDLIWDPDSVRYAIPIVISCLLSSEFSFFEHLVVQRLYDRIVYP